MIAAARALIALAAALVPRRLRRDWHEQWLGELEAIADGATGRDLLRFAIGAPRHAAIEALDEWTTNGIMRDAGAAIRRLAREPLLTLTGVGVVAVAVAANAAIFSVINATLLRTPPAIQRGDRLVQIGRAKATGAFDPVSFPVLVDIRTAAVPALQEVAAYASERVAVDDGTGARLAAGQLVTAGFFSLLGAPPAPGREFTADEERRGDPVAVIARAFWRRRFNGDPAAVGASLIVDGIRTRIVGVAPATFVGPDAGTAAPDVWLPMGFGVDRSGWLQDRRRSWIWAFGRLRDGASIAQARAGLVPVNEAIERAYPGTMTAAMAVVPGVGLQPDARREARAVTLLLMTSVAIVLAIACANVAGLLLARASKRRRELALRLAIGASRARIVRESLIESVLLALLAGGAAAALCQWASGGVRALMPYELAVSFAPDTTVFAFTFACAALTGVVIGVLPARQAARTDLMGLIREDVLAPRAGRARAALLVVQIALSFALIAGTAVLVRSLVNAQLVDPGFDPDGVVVATVDFPPTLKDDGLDAAVEALSARLRRLPGAVQVAAVSRLPVADSLSRRSLLRPDDLFDLAGDPAVAPSTAVDASYFRTMGIAIVRGRAFERTDRRDADKVAIVSASLARRVFGAADPIGQSLRAGPDRVRVVGVAADTAATSLRDRAMTLVYQPLAQQRSHDLTFLVRVAMGLEAESLVGSVREAVAGAATGRPVVRVAPLRTLITASLAETRLTATLLAIYGAVALLLATVGLGALQLQSTRQRQREFGVRLALGASPRLLQRSVVGAALRLTAAGVALGAGAALAMGRGLERLLFGVRPADPVALVMTAALFVACSLAAAAAPAWAAGRLDPVSSLRQD